MQVSCSVTVNITWNDICRADSVSVGAVGTYEFTYVTCDHTIMASFKKRQYTITVMQGVNGTISPDTATVEHGGCQTFTVIPAEGYETEDVNADSLSVGAVATYEFTDVTGDHTIMASFKKTEYIITATSGTG